MGELNQLKITANKPLHTRINIDLPRSKSICNRLLIMEAISGGAVKINHLSQSDDSVFLGNFLKSTSSEKWVGEAGTAFRFGLAWAAITPGSHIIDGAKRIKQRPIGPLVDALRALGADITYLESGQSAPLAIEGKKLKGGEISIEGSMSSQFVSALLLVGPYFEKGLTLLLDPNQVSKPYIELTLALMKMAGAEVSSDGHKIVVQPKPYQPCEITVEPDWSAASYFYAFQMQMGGVELFLDGLKNHSLQGDSVVQSIGEKFGVATNYNEQGAILQQFNKNPLPGELDFIDCPDLAQTIAVMAAAAQNPLHLTGLQTLAVKETNRIEALKTELGKCGVHCSSTAETLTLERFEKPTQTPVIATYSDHRMAMAFAPLAAVYGEIIIENPDVVSKSFPNYWEQVEKMGFQITRM